MQKVGLTGNIGSGKTTVCRVFEMLDIPVYYADAEARKILYRKDVADKLGALFGKEVLDRDGKPDRKKIAGIVFSDPAQLKKLNALVHPLVRRDYETWLEKQSDSPYTIQEAAILFETGHYKRFDKTILVTAPTEVRIDRVCRRDKVSAGEVRARMRNQAEQQELEKLADYVICNDGKLLVIPQILIIHQQLGGNNFTKTGL
jgi:dephospho-CoA kinase